MRTFYQMFSESTLKNPFLDHQDLPEVAFMTTYVWDNELLETILQSPIHIIVANSYETTEVYKSIEDYTSRFKNFTLLYPPKNRVAYNYGAFHPKIWVFKFPKTLRIVISSGNLTIGDWSVWSNCWWFRDFPKKEIGKIDPKAI